MCLCVCGRGWGWGCGGDCVIKKSNDSHHYLDCFMLPTVSQSPSSACIYIPRPLQGHNCFTVSSHCMYTDIWHHSCLCMFCQSSLDVYKRAYMLHFMPLSLCTGAIMFSCCPSLHLSIRPSICLAVQSLKYPLSTYTYLYSPLVRLTSCDQFEIVGSDVSVYDHNLLNILFGAILT